MKLIRILSQSRVAKLSAFLLEIGTLSLAVGRHPTAIAASLLPDLFSWESEARNYMHGGTFDLDSEPGRVLYRFNVAIPNIGDGPFEVFEITHPSGIQDVYQNIYDSGGGFTQVLIGSFMTEPDPPFGHLHLEGLAQYSLREVVEGGGVGPIVASHLKTSHGLVDSVSYDTGLPGAPATPAYTSALQNPLGVSVGWADFYSKAIPLQRIDVTGVASGQYWLEVVIDPNSMVSELDETNNTTRILVDLQLGGLYEADFDLDGDVDHDDLTDPADGWEARFGVDLDGSSFLTWQQQRGSGVAEPLSTLTAVPEPSGLAMAVYAASFGMLIRRATPMIVRKPS